MSRIGKASSSPLISIPSAGREIVEWTPAYIALGSNLDDPAAQIRQAIEHIMQIRDTRVIAQSSLYKTAPLGPQDQPDFVNAVIGALTRLDAMSLLAELQGIEKKMGRVPPAQRWGARVIDLDILLHGDSRSNSPYLLLPHPEMHKRNFVMIPLADIAPALVIPVHGTVRRLVDQLGDDGLRKIA
jgi:2-amino-4-hydroxy-6-hydroxymethyldihydropteridine diphosphokinase